MELDTPWTWSPVMTVVILALGWRLGRVSGERWRTGVLVAALLLAAAAAMSPLAAMAEQLFAVHMLQHLALLDLIPILLLMSLPPEVAEAVRRSRAVAALSSRPVVAIALYVGNLWIMHLPGPFEFMLEHPLVHELQNVWLMLVGLAFWSHAVGPQEAGARFRGPVLAAYMGSTKLLTGVLATLIMFTGFAEYAAYELSPRPTALSAQEDREIAGGVMMVWELLVMAAAFAAMFIRMLGDSEREERALEESLSGG